MCIHIYIYIYIHIYKYIHINYECWQDLPVLITPSPPTKSLDFRGFASSRLLILRGGNSRVR